VCAFVFLGGGGSGAIECRRAGARHQHRSAPARARHPPCTPPRRSAPPAAHRRHGNPARQAGQAAFDAALQSHLRAAARPGQRAPQPITINGMPVEPWHLWREVWSWGGPEACSKQKVRRGAGGTWGVVRRALAECRAQGCCGRSVALPSPTSHHSLRASWLFRCACAPACACSFGLRWATASTRPPLPRL
jgi:hypothetical protein